MRALNCNALKTRLFRKIVNAASFRVPFLNESLCGLLKVGHERDYSPQPGRKQEKKY
jgi:hypothetical protein